MRRVYADGRIGRARTTRHQANTGFAGEFGVRLGHEGRTTFLPANDKSKIVSVAIKTVKHAEIAFTGHAKSGVYTVGNQCISNQMATGTGGGGKCRHTCKLIQELVLE